MAMMSIIDQQRYAEMLSPQELLEEANNPDVLMPAIALFTMQKQEALKNAQQKPQVEEGTVFERTRDKYAAGITGADPMDEQLSPGQMSALQDGIASPQMAPQAPMPQAPMPQMGQGAPMMAAAGGLIPGYQEGALHPQDPEELTRLERLVRKFADFGREVPPVLMGLWERAKAARERERLEIDQRLQDRRVGVEPVDVTAPASADTILTEMVPDTATAELPRVEMPEEGWPERPVGEPSEIVPPWLEEHRRRTTPLEEDYTTYGVEPGILTGPEDETQETGREILPPRLNPPMDEIVASVRRDEIGHPAMEELVVPIERGGDEEIYGPPAARQTGLDLLMKDASEPPRDAFEERIGIQRPLPPIPREDEVRDTGIKDMDELLLRSTAPEMEEIVVSADEGIYGPSDRPRDAFEEKFGFPRPLPPEDVYGPPMPEDEPRWRSRTRASGEGSVLREAQEIPEEVEEPSWLDRLKNINRVDPTDVERLSLPDPRTFTGSYEQWKAMKDWGDDEQERHDTEWERHYEEYRDRADYWEPASFAEFKRKNPDLVDSPIGGFSDFMRQTGDQSALRGIDSEAEYNYFRDRPETNQTGHRFTPHQAGKMFEKRRPFRERKFFEALEEEFGVERPTLDEQLDDIAAGVEAGATAETPEAATGTTGTGAGAAAQSTAGQDQDQAVLDATREVVPGTVAGVEAGAAPAVAGTGAGTQLGGPAGETLSQMLPLTSDPAANAIIAEWRKLEEELGTESQEEIDARLAGQTAREADLADARHAYDMEMERARKLGELYLNPQRKKVLQDRYNMDLARSFLAATTMDPWLGLGAKRTAHEEKLEARERRELLERENLFKTARTNLNAAEKASRDGHVQMLSSLAQLPKKYRMDTFKGISDVLRDVMVADREDARADRQMQHDYDQLVVAAERGDVEALNKLLDPDKFPAWEEFANGRRFHITELVEEKILEIEAMPGLSRKDKDARIARFEAFEKQKLSQVQSLLEAIASGTIRNGFSAGVTVESLQDMTGMPRDVVDFVVDALEDNEDLVAQLQT